MSELRLGPRPLPLHLMTHASTVTSSRAALPLLRNGSLPWRPHLAPAAAELRESLANAGPDDLKAFDAAVTAEAMRRHRAFLAGIDAYRRHPYHRELAEPPCLWQEGTTRLLDYREPKSAGGVPVLVVPSLINRSYILDLTARRSLLRSLARKGLAPLLVDWGTPGETEAGFTLTDYIAGRLERALEVAVAELGRPVASLGYCMGGLLALALAQRRPDAVQSIVLLATPWDFCAGREAHALMMRALALPLGEMIGAMGSLSVDFLNAMFASLDPALSARKFTAFARLPRRSARARDFVALEDWANDGVPLAGPVARECLFGWYGDNEPARGLWKIAGRAVTPEEITQPVLVVVPERDRIVPPASSLPLADRLPNAQVLTLKGGHVGMLTSPRATTEVYGPLAKWLTRSALHKTGCAP